MLSRDISACRHLRITSRKKTARDGCYKTATPTTINVSTWYVEIAPDWKQFSTPKEIDRDARAREIRDAIYIPSVCDCDSRAPLHKTTTASRRAAAWLECREHNLRSTHTATLACPDARAPPLSMAALSALQESQVCTRWRLQAEPSWPAPRLAARAGALSLRASARAGSSPPPCKGRASPP